MVCGAQPYAPHYRRWNGLGGKLQEGETPEQCARREVFEEAGISVEKLDYVGFLRSVGFRRPENDVLVHLYRVYSYRGLIRPNRREGRLWWFATKNVPAIDTLEADQIFLPWILAGHSFDATVYYSGEEFVKLEVSRWY
jgi:8-oxo-dGTP diphosphatase